MNYHPACLATAGDPPALLCRPDGRTDTLRIPPGLLPGIDPDAEYQTTDIPLPPGGVLILYTGGLVECPGTGHRRPHLRARRPPGSRRGRGQLTVSE
ncbi:SpoIIE family protein phosphatase [Streptomyces sp. NPDC056333]|uniref:SpoIIE family protein phosphatase n=1 Tax=Streptomyces sp. NPDC056333 TaxID=3345786 RepID=UPI0035E173F5